MVNKSELKIKKDYENIGFTVIHGGSPDFLIFRYNQLTKTMDDIHFVEVKSSPSYLSLKQCFWHCALEQFNAPIKVIVVFPDGTSRDIEKEWNDRNYANFYCNKCYNPIKIHKSTILDRLRTMNSIPMENDFLSKGRWNIADMIEDYNKKIKKS